MIVNQVDRIVAGGYNLKRSIDLDVNNDSLADFRLSSEIWGSPGMGMHPSVTFMCLSPNSLMNGYFYADTVFLHHIEETTNDNSLVYINHKENYSCQRIDSGDSVVSVRPNKFSIKYFHYGDKNSKLDTFHSDSLNLTSTSITDLPVSYRVNDTVIYYNSSHHSGCHSMPNDEILYLGVKLTDSEKEKLGWIKMSIISEYQIVLLETAIQK